MTLTIDVDDEAWREVPGLEDLARRSVAAAFAACRLKEEDCEIAILFADDAQVAELNGEWRNKPYATNVLSFPAPGMTLPPGEPKPLGDIVLASGVVAREASEQGKPLPHHVAHLIIHGLLHLLGHDHEDEAEAEAMERLEADILKGLGIPDPYERS